MDLFGFDPPQLGDREVARIAREVYGIAGSQHRLRGERSHNTLITTPDGRRVVLKIASSSDPVETIEFHAAALAHLERTAPHVPVARMVRALSGETVPVLDRQGARHAMRMVTFLPGVTFDDDQQISPTGLQAVGRLVGALSAALSSFRHRGSGGFMPWDIGNGLVLDDELWSTLAADARTLLEPVRPQLAGMLDSMLRLPRQVIHNDAHAGNLLRTDAGSDVVTGVIDFGDLVETAAVADLGVSGANLVPHQPDPVAALADLVRGFHECRPLDDDEVAAVPELVMGRLALSMLFTDYQIERVPHIAAAVATERPRLIANLARWAALDRARVTDRIAEVAR